MGATAPMVTGLLKSVLSPTAIGSVVKMVVNAVSSIDIGKIIGTIVTAPMNLLDINTFFA